MTKNVPHNITYTNLTQHVLNQILLINISSKRVLTYLLHCFLSVLVQTSWQQRIGIFDRRRFCLENRLRRLRLRRRQRPGKTHYPCDKHVSEVTLMFLVQFTGWSEQL